MIRSFVFIMCLFYFTKYDALRFAKSFITPPCIGLELSATASAEAPIDIFFANSLYWGIALEVEQLPEIFFIPSRVLPAPDANSPALL